MSKYKLIPSILLLLFSSLLNARELQTTVKYVSGSSIYIDAGRLQGIARDDVVKILRSGILVADLVVTFIADNSAACKIVEQFDRVQIGDIAIVDIKEIFRQPVKSSIPDKKIDSATDPEILKPAQRKANRVSGRIGLQYYFQDNLDEFNYDMQQPATSVRLSVDNVLDSQHKLDVRFRARKNIRNQNLSSSSQSEWNNRIYQVTLSYDNLAGIYDYKIGRVLSPRISGIGTFDGALVGYDFSDRLSAGAFAGTQPDFRNTNFQTDEMKAGVYVSHRKEFKSDFRYEGTFALAGKYLKGEISKEFIYEQTSFRWGSILSLRQSSELNINRGWRKEAEGSSLNLSSLLFNLRYMPIRSTSFTLGYDNRALIRTYETRETPDSLFDNALRQGFRIGMSTRMPEKIRLYLRSGLRFRKGEKTVTRNLSAGVSQRDVFATDISADIRVNTFENSFSSGWQPSIRVSRMFYRKLSSYLQLGQSAYTLKDRDEHILNNWIKLGLDIRITRTIYTSAYTEFYRGQNLNANYFFIESGVRF